MNVLHISYPLTDNYLPSVIAIGFFDGIHIGHQMVISKACSVAAERKLPCAVMTFDPHPKTVTGEIAKIEQITPLDSKLQQLSALNIDICYVVNFTKEFAGLTPKEFIEDFLMRLKPAGVVVGFDFTFGKKGEGTVKELLNFSAGRFTCDVVEPHFDHIGKISSTRVRDALLTGRVDEASQLLGRNYSFSGKVIHGEKRGRTIGFPTANLELSEDYLPIKRGVYLVKVTILDSHYNGVMNVGYKPTFALGQTVTYEIFLLDFNHDIYGQIIQVELVDFLRGEVKFANIQELKVQISKDVQFAQKRVGVKKG